jgi:hypothetical protein
MVTLSKSTGIASKDVAGMVGELSRLGGTQTANLLQMEKIADSARKSGLSAKGLMTTVKTGLKDVSGFGFKNGIDGLTKMAKQAMVLRTTMETLGAKGLQAKVLDPEKAIETAAAFQMMGGAVGKLALKNTDEMVKFANSNPAFKKQYLKLGEELNNPMIKKTIDGVSGVSTRLGSELQQSITQHKSVISKLLSRPIGVSKSIGKEVAAGGKVSTGIKNFFQGEKLAKYVTKKGMEPQTWLSKWYNVVYKGRMGRKNFVKNLILSILRLINHRIPLTKGAILVKIENYKQNNIFFN